ncbi:helix-turn-helix domain-containing protein [Shouchella clausii]|uniref:helix-turn-helix domain-containing protein n=1 Tax=Shouchella clausii TaxID=79880 RepID=UPI000B96FC0B|nr:AraC family transcriptional regulator [Shouchella clausii]AST96827.1 hypothetical protein BC8716_13055 [Shouchella clausii]MCR1287230.1 AraC family transcriptional regulator [Shouchella clausii]MEB5471624.1 AraC family transcriptional regulator [Shouchella clausii]MED4158548.1 AraC family transcriptional regulator [Shouchella clausii]MED4177501.1 AraC family transcriptional regulator [Shouchella clausii]
MERYNQLAQAFAYTPIRVYGVYKSMLEANRLYRGHVDQPTAYGGLILGLRGSARFTFNGSNSIEVSQGKAIIGGYQMRLELEVGETGCEYALIHFLPEDRRLPEATLFQKAHQLEYLFEPSMLQMVDELLQADAAPGEMAALQKKALFYQLLTHVLQLARFQQKPKNSEAMEETIRYIHAHYHEPLTLGQLAARYDMAPKYFSAAFRKCTGVGPIDYVIHCRMKRARQLLMTGAFTVSAVARSVGYQDPYYFSRLFKKQFGVAPSYVRLEMKK